MAGAGQSGLSGNRLEHDQNFFLCDDLVHCLGVALRLRDSEDEKEMAFVCRGGDNASVLDEFRCEGFCLEDDVAPGWLAASVLSDVAQDPRVDV